MNKRPPPSRTRIVLPINGATIAGELTLPDNAVGLVIFAHDTPGSRHCSCNTVVAQALHAVGMGTLLFDLLSEAEAASDSMRTRLCANTPLLAGRLLGVTRWLIADPRVRNLRLGYCGACAGGAASLVAAAWLGQAVGAVVARTAFPDMADGALKRVVSPSLFIVAERDGEAWQHNKEAVARMGGPSELAVISGASELFQEPVSLEETARLSAAWFARHLRRD